MELVKSENKNYRMVSSFFVYCFSILGKLFEMKSFINDLNFKAEE